MAVERSDANRGSWMVADQRLKTYLYDCLRLSLMAVNFSTCTLHHITHLARRQVSELSSTERHISVTESLLANPLWWTARLPEKQRNKERDRQTDRQTDRQINNQTKVVRLKMDNITDRQT